LINDTVMPEYLHSDSLHISQTSIKAIHYNEVH
jgi:hypothetical protein